MNSEKFLFVLLIAALMLCSTFAFASEKPALKWSAGNSSSFSVDSNTAGPSGYVRDGAKVTDFRAGVDARGGVSCGGGSWNAENIYGTCFYAGSDTHCNCVGQCETVRWDTQAANMQISETTRCGGDYCFVEATDSPGSASNMEMGKTKHDHMFYAHPGGDAFIDYAKCGALHWMERVGGPDLDMMIPTKCEDYRNFLNNHPGNTVSIEAACRPANFALCPQSPPRAYVPDPACCPGQPCWKG